MLSGSKDAVGKRELSDEEEELERDGKGRGGKGETEGQHGDKDGKGKRDRPEEKNDDKRSGGQRNRDANRDAEGKRERPERNGEGNHGNKSETEGKHGGKRGRGNHTWPEHSGEGKNGTKRDAEDAHRQPEENREGMFDRGPGHDEGERVELQENTGKSDSSREDPRPNSPGQSADLGDEDNLRLTSLNNFISKSWNIGGTLDVSIGSSMEPAQVLQMFDQNRTLLEDAIARSHGYIKVVILGVDNSRRLRSATVTRIRVRFQAESTIPPPERVVPTQSDLSQTLQQSFAKAGLDFQVQSAAVVITSSEFSEPDRSEQNDVVELDVLFIAGGLIMLCSCVAMLCLCKRQHSRANNVPKHEVSANVIHIAPVVIAKSYDVSDKDDKDLDLASVSTGTPSSSKSDLSLF
jgi:hypothetical protein